MSERYPDDATLLAMESDADTGVELIATGQSPYYLQFRKLVQRLLLASKRANDLRVYPEDDLSIGVRPGRCLMHGQPVSFDGATGIAVANNTTTHVWLDDNGDIQTGESGLPADRTSFVPLAEVVSDAGAISQINDLRGEAFLNVTDLGVLGVTTTPQEINQSLDGINGSVDAAALNLLTGGTQSDADSEHRHQVFFHDVDAEASLTLTNTNAGGSANVALLFDLAGVLPYVTALVVDPTTGWLKQRYAGVSYPLVGSSQVQYRHEGQLTSTQTGKLTGIVPIDGVVTDVILSIGTNMQSSISTDGVSATAKINGVALTTTDPQITSAAGSGFRSTAQGHGTAAVVKTDGTEQVGRGKVLTVDLTRTAAGSISQEAVNVVAMVVIRPNKPE